MPFEEMLFNKTSEFIEFLTSLDNSYIYRGQMEDWELETSLQRSDINLPSPYGEEYEAFLKALARSKDLFNELKDYSTDNLFDFISLLQHYRVPTNLLDFTHSPIVALYFSLQQALSRNYNIEQLSKTEKQYCIYAIDTVSLNTQSENKIIRNLTDLNYDSIFNFSIEEKERYDQEVLYSVRKLVQEKPESLFGNSYFKEFNTIVDPTKYRLKRDDLNQIIFTVKNFKHNRRSLAQQSVFLTQSSYEGKLYTYLRKYKDIGYKLLIPYSNTFDIITYLEKININPMVISPDLDGYLTHEWEKFLFSTHIYRKEYTEFVIENFDLDK